MFYCCDPFNVKNGWRQVHFSVNYRSSSSHLVMRSNRVYDITRQNVQNLGGGLKQTDRFVVTNHPKLLYRVVVAVAPRLWRGLFSFSDLVYKLVRLVPYLMFNVVCSRQKYLIKLDV